MKEIIILLGNLAAILLIVAGIWCITFLLASKIKVFKHLKESRKEFPLFFESFNEKTAINSTIEKTTINSIVRSAIIGVIFIGIGIAWLVAIQYAFYERCPECQTLAHPSSTYCEECGIRLNERCDCGFDVTEDAKYCPKCGRETNKGEDK